MSVKVTNGLPANVIEIGNEVSQAVVDGLMGASPSASSANPFLTVDGADFLPLTGGTMAATATIQLNNSDIDYTYTNLITGNSLTISNDQGNFVGLNFYQVSGGNSADSSFSLSEQGVGGSSGGTSWGIGSSGVTFPDATVQYTAGLPLTGGTLGDYNEVTNSVVITPNSIGVNWDYDNLRVYITPANINLYNDGETASTTLTATSLSIDGGFNADRESVSVAEGSVLINCSGITFPDSTVQTTAAVAPTFATDAEVIAGTSASTVMSPVGARVSALNPQFKDFTNRVFSFSGVGGGGVINLNNSRDIFDLSANNTNAGVYAFLTQSIEGLYNSNITTVKINWSKPFELRGRLFPGSSAPSSSNAIFRVYVGSQATTAILGDPIVKSVGIKNTGGGQIQLMVHNGTSLFTVNTGYTCSTSTWFDFILSSDGAGNATLTINGTNTATSANAPTGTSGVGNGLYIIAENIGAITGNNLFRGTNIKGIFNA